MCIGMFLACRIVVTKKGTEEMKVTYLIIQCRLMLVSVEPD